MRVPNRLGLYLALAILSIGIWIARPKNPVPAHFRQDIADVKVVTLIHIAEAQYYAEHGRYASVLTQLGPGPDNANLIDEDLARGEKGGFKFILQPASPAGYTIFVGPAKFGISGGHTYYSDQSTTIHQHNGRETATVNDPPLSWTSAAQTPAAATK